MFNVIDNNKTIIAPATPQGKGALAIIRISGTDAINIIQNIFYVKKMLRNSFKNRVAYFGEIIIKEQIIDEVLLTVFHAPNSYTGENLVEISCHNSPYIIQTILNDAIHKGCRLARAGEFTQRAFMNGKMQLTQAEAVADLISSDTQAAHHSAINSLKGGIQNKLQELRQGLIKFAALIELELDFSQEDVAFADRTQLLQLITLLQQETNKLLHSFKTGNAIKEGIKIVIAGKPNVGKSTLLNQILKDQKAIVSPIAGTTRDIIEDTIFYKDIKFRFLDTAGIHDNTKDEIEKIGIEKTKQNILNADMVLYLIDNNFFDEQEINTNKIFFTDKKIKYFFVVNKTEQLNENNKQQWHKLGVNKFISAQHNIGVDELLNDIYNTTIDTDISKEEAIITNMRHYELLLKIDTLLNAIFSGIQNNLSGDLLSIEIKHCLHHIGELSGEVHNEHLLDFIFSEFCIGK